MSRLSVLLSASVFLLLPLGAKAQMTVAGPPSPTAHTLTDWFAKHIPAKFSARGPFEVQALSDEGMDDYLHGSDGDDDSRSNSQADDDEIDGVFVDHPPRIMLRVSAPDKIDFYTLAHEYGHYVWFNLLTKGDRRRYGTVYNKQKAAHKLVTDYAAESLEEGFAEAFAADVDAPAALLHQDPLSYRFLAEWPKER